MYNKQPTCCISQRLPSRVRIGQQLNASVTGGIQWQQESRSYNRLGAGHHLCCKITHESSWGTTPSLHSERNKWHNPVDLVPITLLIHDFLQEAFALFDPKGSGSVPKGALIGILNTLKRVEQHGLVLHSKTERCVHGAGAVSAHSPEKQCCHFYNLIRCRRMLQPNSACVLFDNWERRLNCEFVVFVGGMWLE